MSRAEPSSRRAAKPPARGPDASGTRVDPVEAAALAVPPAPAGAVRRPRLEARLDDGVQGPLTLVSAPAGTGKTVLVSSWAAALEPRWTAVWLSLHDAAVAPGTFWRLL